MKRPVIAAPSALLLSLALAGCTSTPTATEYETPEAILEAYEQIAGDCFQTFDMAPILEQAATEGMEAIGCMPGDDPANIITFAVFQSVDDHVRLVPALIEEGFQVVTGERWISYGPTAADHARDLGGELVSE